MAEAERDVPRVVDWLKLLKKERGELQLEGVKEKKRKVQSKEEDGAGKDEEVEPVCWRAKGVLVGGLGVNHGGVLIRCSDWPSLHRSDCNPGRDWAFRLSQQ